MIIWLNGAFGGGKTTTAAALRPLIPASRLLVPATVGYMLQANPAGRPVPGYLAARSWMIPAADLVVDTGAVTPAEVAGQIAGALPGMS